MTLTLLSMVRLRSCFALLVVALLTCGCDKLAAFKASDSRDAGDASIDSVDDIEVMPGESPLPDLDAGCPDDANCSGPVLDKIVYGARHACALLDGVVYCWGDNDRAQIGVSNLGSDPEPAAVSGLPAPVRDVCANDLNTCVVDGGGNVLCWGDNSFGQLGNNAINQSSKPAQIKLPLSSVAVSCGGGFACAIASTGNVYCWGRGDSGQLGSGSSNSSQPQIVPKVVAVDQIACGASHCCSRRGGTVQCWGDPSSGKLGSSTTARDPIALGISGFNAISSHANHTCGINNSGEVYCWGDNSYSQLTGSDAAASSVPRKVGLPTTESAVSVATGSRHSCAALKSGEVYCWGHDLYGQLGRGARPGRSPNPTAVPTTSGATRVFAGADNNCVQTQSGLYCWGRNTFGQVGDRFASRRPVALAQSKKLDDVASGAYHVCARSGTAASCWGFNSHAQSASTTDAFVAAPLSRGEPPMVAPDLIGLGTEHTCVVNQSIASCTGRGDGGQLDGVARGPRVATFFHQSLLLNVFVMVGGRQHSCAIAAAAGGSRSAYCWGVNSQGQLGANVGPGVHVAQFAMKNVASLSAGGDTTCAVHNLGTLFCWGRNDQGQAGTTPSGPVALPTQIGLNLGSFSQVSVGAAHACAVGVGGAVYCWGRNVERQLGTPTPDSGMPTPVVYKSVPLVGVHKVAAGGRHTCALQGKIVICWGDNRALQSGQATPGLVAPTAVPAPGPVEDVVVGAAHTCIVVSGATPGLYCFGDDYFAQLGSGKMPQWAPHPVTLP